VRIELIDFQARGREAFGPVGPILLKAWGPDRCCRQNFIFGIACPFDDACASPVDFRPGRHVFIICDRVGEKGDCAAYPPYKWAYAPQVFHQGLIDGFCQWGREPKIVPVRPPLFCFDETLDFGDGHAGRNAEPRKPLGGAPKMFMSAIGPAVTPSP